MGALKIDPKDIETELHLRKKICDTEQVEILMKWGYMHTHTFSFKQFF